MRPLRAYQATACSTSPARSCSRARRSAGSCWRTFWSRTCTASVGAVEEPGERAAGADGAELAVVADQHHLRPRRVRRDEEAEEVAVVGHGGLVEDDHGPGVEVSRSWSRRHSSDARVRLSMPASRPRVRAAWPDVDAPITRYPAASKASRTTGQRGGLARARHADDQLHARGPRW